MHLTYLLLDVTSLSDSVPSPDEIAALTLAAVTANIGSFTPSNLIVRPFRALRLVVRSLPFE